MIVSFKNIVQNFLKNILSLNSISLIPSELSLNFEFLVVFLLMQSKYNLENFMTKREADELIKTIS